MKPQPPQPVKLATASFQTAVHTRGKQLTALFRTQDLTDDCDWLASFHPDIRVNCAHLQKKKQKKNNNLICN